MSAEEVRRLELELGVRPWDEQDEHEFWQRLTSQVRYIDAAHASELLQAERERHGATA